MNLEGNRFIADSCIKVSKVATEWENWKAQEGERNVSEEQKIKAMANLVIQIECR